MNESEWSDLQGLWKSAPRNAEPVLAELERLRRWRRWRVASALVELVIGAGGLTAGIALLGSGGGPFAVVAGTATCLFVVVVSALSLSVWRLPRPRPEDAIEHAVAVARQHARVGVRYASAVIWALVAGLVFSAAMALARGLLSETAAPAGYVAIGAMQLMLAFWLALAFRYYQARSAALARLDAIAAALEQ